MRAGKLGRAGLGRRDDHFDRLVRKRVDARVVHDVVLAREAGGVPLPEDAHDPTASSSISRRSRAEGQRSPRMCSFRFSPVPTPRKKRPGISDAAVAAACATIAGWMRMVGQVTPVPTRSFSVDAAMPRARSIRTGSALPVDPRVEVVRDQRVREPGLLSARACAHEIEGSDAPRSRWHTRGSFGVRQYPAADGIKPGSGSSQTACSEIVRPTPRCGCRR